jgi:mRNA interferase RelE/StbE
LSSGPKSPFGFAYSESSLSYLEMLTVKLRRQITNKIATLASNPLPQGHKVIQGTSGDTERVYRIRSGDYRILYVVRNNPNHIVILDIDHRKDVYK